MGKVDLSRFGGIRGTKLTPEELTGDIVIVTIKEYGEQKNTGEGRKLSPVLRYEESPEKLHYLNREQMERLVAKLGDDTERWIGKRIPIHAEDVEYEGKTFSKVYVMPPEEWEAAFKEAASVATAEDESRSTSRRRPAGAKRT